MFLTLALGGISTVELPTVASPKVKTLSLIAPPTGIIPIPKPRTFTFTYMLGGNPTISITVLKSSIPTNYSQVRLNCVKIAKGTNIYTRMTAMPLISGSYSANILLPYTVTLKDIVKFDLISLDGYKNRKWYTIAYLKRQRYVVV